MIRRIGCSVVALALVFTATLSADEITAAQIQQAIKDLGDKRFAVRERASKLLWTAGAAAEKPLRAVLDTEDAETVRRAKALLDKFSWGIFPDTPANIVTQINAFREGDRDVRLQVVTQLMSMGKPGYAALKRLADRETNAADKQAIFARIAQEGQRALPALLAAGEIPAVEELLDRCLLGGTETAFTNYAAFQALNRRLANAIEEWQKEYARAGSATSGTVLVHLLRASGEFARARPIAAAVGETLEVQLLWEEGNWKALSERFKAATAETRDAATLGAQAAVHLRAGDRNASEAAMARLLKLGDSDDRFEQESVAHALLLNGRHADALKLLTVKKCAPALTFELLFTRMQYREAFEFAAAAVPDKDDRFRLDIREARARYILGERDAALKQFDRLAASLKETGDISLARALADTLVSLSLTERADTVGGRFLELLRKQDVREGLIDVLEPIFGDDAPAALTWWLFLRRTKADDDPTATMAIVRKLLGGQAVADRDEWCKSITRANDSPDPRPRSPATGAPLPAAFSAAVVQARARQEARAVELFEQAMAQQPDVTVPMQCADFLTERGRLKEAAAWYDRASKIAPSDPLPVFLRGTLLTKGGDTKEGRRLVALAHQMPLGNEEERGRFADELRRRGFREDAAQELDLVRTVGWYRQFRVGNFLARAARELSLAGNHEAAARYLDMTVLGAMRLGSSYAAPEAYLRVPQKVVELRMRSLIKAGKLADAIPLATAGLSAIPGDSELIIPMVAALDDGNRRNDANEMFTAALNSHTAACRDFPNSAFTHNALAWLCAGCNRELDLALRHAQDAVRLNPESASCRDTLAEVQFRQGEQAKAIETMKKCLELRPGRPYFQRQLARFVSGDRRSPTPSSDD